MPDLRICPKCRRISVEYDYMLHIDRCLWKDCGWNSKQGGHPRQTYSEDFLPPAATNPERWLKKAV